MFRRTLPSAAPALRKRGMPPGTITRQPELMDVAYHLNFGAYTSMTLQYSPPTDAPEAEDLVGVARIGIGHVQGRGVWVTPRRPRWFVSS